MILVIFLGHQFNLLELKLVSAPPPQIHFSFILFKFRKLDSKQSFN